MHFCLCINVYCIGQYTQIPDPNFESALSAYDDIPSDGQIPTANISSITNLNVSSSNITNMSGIEDFDALVVLYTRYNQITSLDLTNNLDLQIVDCRNNMITDLNVSNLLKLHDLNCERNDLQSLDVSTCPKLDYLNCRLNYNMLLLDVSQNVMLTNLICSDIGLNNIDISNNINLRLLHCGNQNISNLDVLNQPFLEDLSCRYSSLSSIDLSQNQLLEKLDLTGNSLSSIDLSINTQLKTLVLSSNDFIAVDLSNTNLLEWFSITGNQLQTLDLSNNPELINVSLHVNQLVNLDLSVNVKLKYIYAGENNLTDITLPTNAPLEDLILELNNLTGCWQDQFAAYCNQLNYFSFFGNSYNGVTDFISDQGFIDFCNNGTGQCCPSTLTLTGSIPSGLYEAGSEIILDGTIQSLESINLHAPMILLESNAEVSPDAVLTIMLIGC